jgi:hypothetical protein
MDFISLVDDRDKWWAVVNSVMGFRFHKMQKISWLAEELSAS